MPVLTAASCLTSSAAAPVLAAAKLPGAAEQAPVCVGPSVWVNWLLILAGPRPSSRRPVRGRGGSARCVLRCLPGRAVRAVLPHGAAAAAPQQLSAAGPAARRGSTARCSPGGARGPRAAHAAHGHRRCGRRAAAAAARPPPQPAAGQRHWGTQRLAAGPCRQRHARAAWPPRRAARSVRSSSARTGVWSHAKACQTRFGPALFLRQVGCGGVCAAGALGQRSAAQHSAACA